MFTLATRHANILGVHLIAQSTLIFPQRRCQFGALLDRRNGQRGGDRGRGRHSVRLRARRSCTAAVTSLTTVDVGVGWWWRQERRAVAPGANGRRGWRPSGRYYCIVVTNTTTSVGCSCRSDSRVRLPGSSSSSWIRCLVAIRGVLLLLVNVCSWRHVRRRCCWRVKGSLLKDAFHVATNVSAWDAWQREKWRRMYSLFTPFMQTNLCVRPAGNCSNLTLSMRQKAKHECLKLYLGERWNVREKKGYLFGLCSTYKRRGNKLFSSTLLLWRINGWLGKGIEGGKTLLWYALVIL